MDHSAERIQRWKSTSYCKKFQRLGLTRNVRGCQNLNRSASQSWRSPNWIVCRTSWLAPVCLRFLYLCALVSAKTPAPITTQSGGSPTTTSPASTNSKNSTQIPSALPTISPAPTISPRPTGKPTRAPTGSPTISIQPSMAPSNPPTSYPTTQGPTFHPTWSVSFDGGGAFRQQFVIYPSATGFNETDIILISNLFGNYTDEFAPDSNYVVTTCVVDESVERLIENVTVNELDYTCKYSSRITNVTDYGDLFLEFMNSNLTQVAIDMRSLGLAVEEVRPTFPISRISPMPSVSWAPSSSPTQRPTITPRPSRSPTVAPSRAPTTYDGPTQLPSYAPTISPSIFYIPPSPSPENGNSIVTAVAIVVPASVLIIVVLLWYYCRSRRKSAQQQMIAESGGLVGVSRRTNKRGESPWGAAVVNSQDDEGGEPISPNESLQSNKSMLSAGESEFGQESGDEADGTGLLEDEFDKYRNESLDQLRHGVEDNVVGLEGIMSAAVTKALMNDEGASTDASDLRWGFEYAKPTGAEIEASALCEVTDWLKRNPAAENERKRLFMQEILNKMVASVRHGIIESVDASRTIHESASLLGLQLVNDLPVTTVLVSGMRKTTSATFLRKAFEEFGKVDEAALASGQRGFGILRFTNSKFAELAMHRYLNGEIVVQDVAVQIKVLPPTAIEAEAQQQQMVLSA